MKNNLLTFLFLPIFLVAASEFFLGCSDNTRTFTNSPDYDPLSSAVQLTQLCDESMMLAMSTCTDMDHEWTSRDHQWCASLATGNARFEECFWASWYGLKCMEDFFYHYDTALCVDQRQVNRDLQRFCADEFYVMEYNANYGCPVF